MLVDDITPSFYVIMNTYHIIQHTFTSILYYSTCIFPEILVIYKQVVILSMKQQSSVQLLTFMCTPSLPWLQQNSAHLTSIDIEYWDKDSHKCQRLIGGEENHIVIFDIIGKEIYLFNITWQLMTQPGTPYTNSWMGLDLNL